MSSSDPNTRAGWALDGLREYERRAGASPLPRIPSLSRYEILGILGEGGIAVVYRARDRELGREVAIKVPREPLIGIRPEVRDRLRREGQVTAGLSHPNVVAVHDVGDAGDRLCLVMELVDGKPLNVLIAGRTLERKDLVRLLEEAARGVAEAHRNGIIHRDLKPANILVDRSGRAKVGDFGLAHVVQSEAELTRTGAVMGTPLYMAPEQVRGSSKEVSPATDVYALGVILYEILAGRPPHGGESLQEIYGRILNDEPLSPRRADPSVPRELEMIALKALEKEPVRRYGAAGDFADDLRRWLDGEPVLARPPSAIERLRRRVRRHRGRVGIAVGVVLLLATTLVAGGIWQRWNAERQAGRLLETARQAVEWAERSRYREDADDAAMLAKIAKSRALIEEAAAAAPRLAMAPHLLGRALDLEGREREAEAAWRKAIDLDPRFAPARVELAKLLMRRAILEEPFSQTGGSRESQDRGRRVADEAARHFQVLSTMPSTDDAGLQRKLVEAMLAFVRDERSAALALCRQMARDWRGKDGEEEFLWLIGLSSSMEEARPALDRAIRIRPNFPAALVARAVHRAKARDFPGALEDLDAALRHDPRFLWAHLNRAAVNFKLDRAADSSADLDRAAALAPDRFEIPSFRGNLLIQAGKPDAAIREFDRALALDPTAHSCLCLRANARISKGDLEAAVADLDKALRICPTSAMAFSERGRVMFLKKEWTAVVTDCSRAIDLEPRLYPMAYACRGVAQENLGRIADARRDFEQTIALAPEGSPPWKLARSHLDGLKETPERDPQEH